MDWEHLYQVQDTGWDRGEASPALQAWLPHLAQTGVQRVLIPGCGRGHEVLALAKEGFDVTGLDFALSAIACLEKKLQQEKVQASTCCEDLFTYQPKQVFDAVYEQTCLCALSPSQREAYERCLYGWLKEGGTLLLLLMQSNAASGPPFHCDFLAMQQLFHASRWQWPEAAPLLVARPKGARFELGFVLKKR